MVLLWGTPILFFPPPSLSLEGWTGEEEGVRTTFLPCPYGLEEEQQRCPFPHLYWLVVMPALESAADWLDPSCPVYMASGCHREKSTQSEEKGVGVPAFTLVPFLQSSCLCTPPTLAPFSAVLLLHSSFHSLTSLKVWQALRSIWETAASSTGTWLL